MSGRFKWGMILRLFALALLMPSLSHALPRQANVPGGVALVRLGAVSTHDYKPPRAWFGEQPVWVVNDGGHWIAVVGLALDLAEGPYELRVRQHDELKEISFQILAKTYPEQRITLKDSGKIRLSEADGERALAEIAEIQTLKRHWSDVDDTDAHFQLPVEGRLASRFGLRRFFNGEPRAPHSGLDVAVPRNTPIKASAQGSVLAVRDYFFNGKTVFVDHGNGLISMYCHLDRIDVQEAEKVGQGQRIGLSGMSGRASGPHLHWSAILNGVMVDPALFLKNQTARQAH